MDRFPGARPLYAQVMEDIKARIDRQEWIPGHRIPGEKELCDTYAVSRTCIRQALAALRAEGYIYAVQGKGTFIANVTANTGWARLSTFESQFQTKWAVIGAPTLEMGNVVVPDKAADFLQVPKGALVFGLTRVRLANARPVIVQRHYLSPMVPRHVFEEQSEFISFSKMLEEGAGIVTASARDLVAAVACPRHDAEILKVKPRSPVLCVDRYSRDIQGRPIEYAQIIVCTDAWRYEVTVLSAKARADGNQI